MKPNHSSQASAKPKRFCPFTPEYLSDYSKEHLWYEVSMFFQTGAVLPYGVTSPANQFVDNAVLESFAIHPEVSLSQTP